MSLAGSPSVLRISVAVVGAASFACGQQPQAAGSKGDAGPALASRAEASPSAPEAPGIISIPVEGIPVRRGTLTLTITAAGDASPSRRTPVLTQVSGPITAVTVREGERVGAGRLLVEIDPAEFELAVREARARLAAAEAQYREMVLFDDRLVDTSVRRERDAAARAKSGIDAARVALERAQLELRRTRILAPFAGSVAGVRVVPGQFARSGEELLTVQDIDPIKVEVRVLESEVGLLAPGHRAIVTFAAFPDRRFTARVVTINPMVEENTRTARVTLTLPNAQRNILPGQRNILPGMYARVSLDARQVFNRVLVPRSAILERDKRTMLFVFEGRDGQGLAKWRYVTTGLANDSLVEIVDHPETDTVRPGEIVLTDGHYTLIHDAKIRLVDDSRETGGRPL